MNTDEAEQALQELVVRCLLRMEDEGEAALEVFCAEHAEHAAAIRSRLKSLSQMGFLRPAAAAAAAFPERLGPFRLLERLGGGGMGIVYVAEQDPLKRRVALKLIRPEHLYFPGARERFRREVEAVARLQHPGIVPIYTVGEEGGIPYFAMEHIAGASVADILRDLASERPERLTGAKLLEVVARDAPGEVSSLPMFTGTWTAAAFHLIREVAHALDHAHRRGVLHRDIKPSNIMLGAGGRVVLLDFGLASMEGSSKLTRTAAPMGSLLYMAPEQVRGDHAHVDQRTDIYSLGVTLYEMLALRAPYFDPAIDAIRQRILEGVPGSIRSHNASVPWDAETVCLTAMDRDPSRRYATAADFARDLTNVLARRPIEARRPSTTTRVLRFVQRHPARTVAIVLATLLAVASPVALVREMGKNREIGAALETARTAQHEAERENERAKAHFARARAAVDQMLARVGGVRLAEVPQMEQVKRQLLEDALRYYEGFVAEGENDAAMRSEMASDFRRLGDVQIELGLHAAAEQSFERALSMLEKLSAEAPADFELESDVATVYGSLGRLQWERGALDEAESNLLEAIAIRERHLQVQPTRLSAKNSLATHRLNLGAVLVGAGRLEEAAECFEQSLRLWQDPGSGDRSAAPERIAACQQNLGTVRQAIGDFAGAEHAYREAIAMLGSRTNATPILRYHLGVAQYNLGGVLYEVERKDEAEPAYRAAFDTFAGLSRDYPIRPDYRLYQARCLRVIGRMHAEAARESAADQAFAEAIAITAKLAAEFPAHQEAGEVLAEVQSSQGWFLTQSHRPAEAEAVLLQALATLERLAASGNLTVDEDLAEVLARLAELRELPDSLERRAAHVAKSIAHARAVLASSPSTGRHRDALAEGLRIQASIALEQADHAAAAAAALESAAVSRHEGDDRVRAAAVLVRCAALATAALAATYTDQALAQLEQAVTAGFADRADLEQRADLDQLRGDPRFAALLENLAR